MTPRASVSALRDPMHRLLMATAVVLSIAMATIPLRTSERIWDSPLGEDGYYALGIARHLGMGHGLTYDGRTPTNGFQPLWVFLIAPLYWLTGGDRIQTLRLVLIVSVLLFMATAAVLGSIAAALFEAGDPRRRLARPAAAAAYLGSGLLFRQHFNGLETGLYLFMLASLWWLFTRERQTPGWAPAFGIVLGVLVLVRIDAVLLVVIIAALFASEARRSRRRWRDVAAAVGGSAVISAPWWIYNVTMFGSLLPTSGSAQADPALSWERSLSAVRALGLNAAPGLYLPDRYDMWPLGLTILRFAVVTGCIILCLQGARRQGQAVLAPGNAAARFGGVMLVFSGTLAIVYTVFFLSDYFYDRYLAPASLVCILIISTALCASIYRSLSSSIMPMAVLGWSLSSAMIIVNSHTGAFGKSSTAGYHDRLLLVQEKVPAAARIASTESGFLGYFRDNVVNLDGKVNPDALRYANDIDTYLAASGVEYLLDARFRIEPLLGAKPEMMGWRFVDQSGYSELWERNTGGLVQPKAAEQPAIGPPGR